MQSSKELAYVIGVLHGDGYLANYKKHSKVGLEAKDPEFVQKFADCLNKEFMLEIKARPFKKKYRGQIKTYFIAYKYSRILINQLSEIKRNFMNELISEPSETICAFLRGLYDSEGSVNYRKGKAYRRISLNMKKPVEFFQLLLSFLQKIGIAIPRLYNVPSSGTFIIEIAHREDIRIFNQKIGFNIVRKQEKLDEIDKSYELVALDRQRRSSIEARPF